MAFDTRTTTAQQNRPDLVGVYAARGRDVRDAGEYLRVEVKVHYSNIYSVADIVLSVFFQMIPDMKSVSLFEHHDFKRMVQDLPASLQRLAHVVESEDDLKCFGIVMIVDPVDPVRIYSCFLQCEPVFPSAAAAGAAVREVLLFPSSAHCSYDNFRLLDTRLLSCGIPNLF